MITLESIRNKRIVVYGTGINAVKCVDWLEKDNFKIEYILDGDGNGGKFKDYNVYKPSEITLSGKYVIVASSEKVYPEIRKRLVEYCEFDDFIYYQWLNKEIVFLHGNCHMDIIEQYLLSSSKFNERYAIYSTPRICTGNCIDVRKLKYMDVWIHEDIQKDNAFGYEFSDEYIKRFVSKNIFEIIMPHLYGLGAAFFPYAQQENERNVALLNGKYQNGMFPIKDEIIEKCIQEKKSIYEIVEYLDSDNIIDKENIYDNFRKYIAKIQEREKKWDIKISEFILENYKKKKLFYDKGHPTNVILKKISEEILSKLSIYDKVECALCLDYHEIPVYSWIRKVLGMEWNENYIRTSKNAIKSANTMNIQEYVREYIWWCYPKKRGD